MALINSNINRDKFVLINNVLKEYDNVEKEIKNLKIIEDFSLFIKRCYRIVWSVEKNTESKNQKVVKTKTWKNNAFIKMCSV